MEARWERRALVFYAFTVAAAVVFALMLQGFREQLNGFRVQLDETNHDLSMIRHQECLDSNRATRQFIAQVNPDPAPTLRDCR